VISCLMHSPRLRSTCDPHRSGKSNFCAASGRHAISPWRDYGDQTGISACSKSGRAETARDDSFEQQRLLSLSADRRKESRNAPRSSKNTSCGPRVGWAGRARIQRHAGICSKRPATHTCSIGRSTTSRDQFEELLEQSQPQGHARARTPPDAAARTFLAHSSRVAPRGHRRPGEGRGGKDRRSATRLIPPFRMIRRPSRRPCSRGTLRAWSYTSPRRYSV
jgi:hypothetical protein